MAVMGAFQLLRQLPRDLDIGADLQLRFAVLEVFRPGHPELFDQPLDCGHTVRTVLVLDPEGRTVLAHQTDGRVGALFAEILDAGRSESPWATVPEPSAPCWP